MSKASEHGRFFYPEVYIKDNKIIRENLSEGDIDYFELTQWSFNDEFLSFLQQSKLIDFADSTYPNPRSKTEVPIWFLLHCQFVLKINSSSSYRNLPYFLNSGAVLSKIGFNLSSMEIGFNKKNRSKRNMPVHQDTVRKFFKSSNNLQVREWYNSNIQSWFKSKKCFNKDGLFIIDQSHVVVPKNSNYKDAVYMPVDEYGHFYKDNQGPPHLCYTLSILLHIDKKQDTLHIAGYEWGAGNEDELPQAEKLVYNFNNRFPNVMKELIADRGYISANFINNLKGNYNVDVLTPLKNNMDNYKDAVSIASRSEWSVTFKDEKEEIQAVNIGKMDLWDGLKYKQTVTVCKKTFQNKDKEKIWVLASTKQYKDPASVIARYKLRWSIEERYRQFKKFWKLDKFSSPDKSLIEAHICFTLFTYSLLQQYLKRSDLQLLANKAIQTMKMDEASGNDNVVIYKNNNFGVISLNEYTQAIIGLQEEAKKRLSETASIIGEFKKNKNY